MLSRIITCAGLSFLISTSFAGIDPDPPPMAMCQDITIQLDASGNYSLDAYEVDGGSTFDFMISVDITTLDCTQAGQSVPVMLTVENSDGQMDTCTANVMVEDVTPPMAFCKDTTVELDATGSGTIAPEDVDNGSIDECSPTVFLSLDQDTFGCGDLGVVQVTLTVEDDAANSESCMASVTVVDNLAPEITTCASPQKAEVSGGGSVAVPDFTADIAASDNCSALLNVAQNPSVGTLVTAGVHSVTMLVSDQNGNTNSCSTTFTVNEVSPPDIFIVGPYDLSFYTVTDRVYTLEYTTVLTNQPQSWIPVVSIPGYDGPIQVNDSNGDPQRSYRLRILLNQ